MRFIFTICLVVILFSLSRLGPMLSHGLGRLSDVPLCSSVSTMERDGPEGNWTPTKRERPL